ncbi:MAG: ASCH domain-containing protein [Bifidobacterium sp.]|jgi:uncharacterized protein YhfF|nr:ASCH domain-containing protein [Bifidobacterium sp.]MCH4175534.1 ASCH domain-containing protein [Bifidobacterium sp.]
MTDETQHNTADNGTDNSAMQEPHAAPNDAQTSEIDVQALSQEAIAQLPKDEFAYPGPIRDALIAAIFSGAKTSTASLYRDFALSNEALPKAGDLSVIIDSDGKDVAILRYTAVTTTRFIDVDDNHAKDEGEGYTDAAGWRQVHEKFWNSQEYLAEYGEGFTLNDETPVVLERFELVRKL